MKRLLKETCLDSSSGVTVLASNDFPGVFRARTNLPSRLRPSSRRRAAYVVVSAEYRVVCSELRTIGVRRIKVVTSSSARSRGQVPLRVA